MPDGNPNAEFMGMITIKYDNNGTKSIWSFFVFKNKDITKHNRFNIITGIHEPVFLCNYRLRYINMYALFEKHAATHYEFLYFIELYKKGKIHIYKPLGKGELEQESSIFISRRDNLDNLEEHPFLKDLQLVKAKLSLQEIPGNIHKFPETNIQLSYSIVPDLSTNMHSGAIKNNIYMNPMNPQLKITTTTTTTTKEDKLYFSSLVISKYYNEFINSDLVLDNLFF